MDDQNANKNAVIGTPFTTDRQPSPEAKSKGWNRKRRAKQMLDKITKNLDMPLKDFMTMIDKIEKGEISSDITVEDAMLANYAIKTLNKKGENVLIDWMDRTVGKATQEIDITTNGESLNLDLSKLSDEELTTYRAILHKITDNKS